MVITMNEIAFEELQAATAQAVALLQEKGNPHMQITITQAGVKIVEEQMGIPTKHND